MMAPIDTLDSASSFRVGPPSAFAVAECIAERPPADTDLACLVNGRLGSLRYRDKDFARSTFCLEHIQWHTVIKPS